MVKWGEAERDTDPEIFCHLASKHCEKPLWIITDARRPSDLQYFETHYPQKSILVRIQCSEAVRKKRGWVFKPGVDDCASECALDEGVAWDIVVDNTNDVAIADIQFVCSMIDKLAC